LKNDKLGKLKLRLLNIDDDYEDLINKTRNNEKIVSFIIKDKITIGWLFKIKKKYYKSSIFEENKRSLIKFILIKREIFIIIIRFGGIKSKYWNI